MAGLLGFDPTNAALISLGAGMTRGDFGGGLLGAGQAYQQAQDGNLRGQLGQLQLAEAQQKMEQMKRQQEFLQNLPAPTPGPTGQLPAGMDFLRQAVQAGVVKPETYLGMMIPKPIEYGKVDPKDYTPESLREAASTGDYSKLVAVRKKEVGPGGQVYDPYSVQSGAVINDPNKPFMIGQGGSLVANAPYQSYEINKSRAGAAVNNISLNTEKTLLNDIAGGLGKNMTAAQEGARSALSTINTVNRLNDALDTGKVMAGPGTTFRQYGLQVGNMLGVTGKDANEKLLNTRQAIQSLAQLELDAAQQMKGQGQITEAERSIIRRAASGDIEGMTAPELRLLGGVLDRTARTKIRSYNQQVQPLLRDPNAAPLAPFLSVQEPPERQAPGAVRRFNPATGKIE